MEEMLVGRLGSIMITAERRPNLLLVTIKNKSAVPDAYIYIL
jgi:hypothetical protein